MTCKPKHQGHSVNALVSQNIHRRAFSLIYIQAKSNVGY